MKKYVAIYHHDKNNVNAEFEIYASSKISIEEVISYYEKENEIKIGKTNRFGSKLIEIKVVNCNDIEIIEPSICC